MPRNVNRTTAPMSGRPRLVWTPWFSVPHAWRQWRSDSGAVIGVPDSQWGERVHAVVRCW